MTPTHICPLGPGTAHLVPPMAEKKLEKHPGSHSVKPIPPLTSRWAFVESTWAFWILKFFFFMFCWISKITINMLGVEQDKQ
ncbi:MAG TPA: hypothetical protein DCS93_41870 [Microscillaceae bacterium]|nr:hypothetical protein [Microscillaceae bacterium]